MKVSRTSSLIALNGIPRVCATSMMGLVNSFLVNGQWNTTHSLFVNGSWLVLKSTELGPLGINRLTFNWRLPISPSVLKICWIFGLPTRVTFIMGVGLNLNIYFMRESQESQSMVNKRKLKPKEVRIMSNIEGLDIEELEGMPSFEFKIPAPVKKEEGVQVVGPTKKNSRLKELF